MTLPAVKDTAVTVCVLALNDLATKLAVNAPCTVAVVVDNAPAHVTEPPEAICAKLGWPPAAWPAKPVQVISVGSVG